MHALLLVIGDNLHQRLHAYADYAKVDPYRVYVEGENLARMAEHFGLATSDSEALVAKMPEWAGCEAEIHQGKICYWLRDNPVAKFDWYEIGGRFSGYLRLREPSPPSLLGRLLGKKPVDRVNRARKDEIIVDEVLANPPFAILAGDAWVEKGWSETSATDDQWQQQFALRFNLVPGHEIITVVDIHS